MLEPGDVAPDFTAQDQAGNTVRLKDHLGKTVVLWFYPKADTPGWTAEGCGFRDLKQEYEKKNAVILGASFDSGPANAKFAQKFNFNFPLLTATKEMAIAYGAAKDASARSAARVGVIIGPDGKVKEWFPKVTAATFPSEALALI